MALRFYKKGHELQNEEMQRALIVRLFPNLSEQRQQEIWNDLETESQRLALEQADNVELERNWQKLKRLAKENREHGI